jgi:hypothetical protein
MAVTSSADLRHRLTMEHLPSKSWVVLLRPACPSAPEDSDLAELRSDNEPARKVGLTEVDVVMEVEESGLNGTSQRASVWPDLHLLAGTGHRQEVVCGGT